MTNKYKISELAKDFKLTSKDIADIVAEKTGAVKKSGAALNETEISIVFNALLNKNEVKSFADYFATGAESRAAAKKAREEEKNKRLKEQMAILEQLKAAAAAQSGFQAAWGKGSYSCSVEIAVAERADCWLARPPGYHRCAARRPWIQSPRPDADRPAASAAARQAERR